jgi:formylmethanofuran dehydrogenase subunit E
MNSDIWNKCVDFHGHSCPGLAIGVKACQAAGERLGITFSPDEEIVCVTENDACCVDAVQVLTGCSVGKGNLIFRNRGKMAFSFFERSTGKKIRIVLKKMLQKEGTDREALRKEILDSPCEELFDFKVPSFEPPEKARLFASHICERCGENTAEPAIRLVEGRKVCLDCYPAYCRGW